ncbi:MAG: hypothetical protein WDN25_12170 [Acetobacteraceae bacterium]
MINEPESDGDDTEREAEAMKAQLRKDVDSWTKARSEAVPERLIERGATAVSTSVAKEAAAPPVRRTKKPAAAAPAAAAPDGRSKPFAMSYGGETDKDYIQYMISRGVR